MLKTLDTVTLRSGEEMTVRLLVPPEPGYTDELAVFLRHKGDESGRSIRSRLEGKYAEDAEDRYFVGEIGGKMAGQLWYGFNRQQYPIANFGHVYTAPEHRKKGITDCLMKYFMEDFKSCPAIAAFCFSSLEWIAGIYLKYGFKPALTGKSVGPLMLANSNIPEDFIAFQNYYYTPANSIKAVKGSMKFHHELDSLLRYSLMNDEKHENRVFASVSISSFRAAAFMQEDLRGHIFCAVTPNDRCVGWSFCLNPFSFGEENQAPIFDWELHPFYQKQEGSFIGQSLEMLAKDGVKQAFSYCFSESAEKIGLLLSCGFKKEVVLNNYCDKKNLNIFRIVF